MKRLFLFLACFTALSVCGQGVFVSWNKFVVTPIQLPCSDSPSPYLIWQGFECNPFDHGPEAWTTNGTGSVVNPGFSSPALSGIKSLQFVFTSAGGLNAELHSPNFAASSEIWVYFLFRPVTIQVGTTKQILLIWDNGGTPAARWDCRLVSDGTIQIGSTGTSTTTGTMIAGTTYHVWVHINAAGSGMDVGFSTTGTRPTSGANFTSMFTVANQNMQHISVGRASGSDDCEYIFDNVLVKTSQIGNNPP